MKSRGKAITCAILSALLLTGCSMQTVDKMYQLPKRSEDYSNLQSAMDKAMTGLKFSAPITGDNQQPVQMADLDGDGEQEYLVFAKGTAELPLRVLIFDRIGDVFVHTETIENNGASFDQVEYVQMDEKPGVEIVIGHQLSDQLVRSMTVYTFASGEAERLISVDYRKFLTVDMEDDGHSELFVLRPNQLETDNGIAELYRLQAGIMERSNQVNLSAPIDKLKRILVGKLYDGKKAVYVASAVGDTALITDVFTQQGKRLHNVILSNENGPGVQTQRNYYIYADDMDNDGVVELPSLLPMLPVESGSTSDSSELILWYAMKSDGEVIHKLYTYYNAVDGWYIKLDQTQAERISVRRLGSVFEFYLWNEDYSNARKLLSVYVLTGQTREEQSTADNRFVLLKTDTVIYAASLEPAAEEYQITQQELIGSFHLIYRDWNSGEM